MSAPDPIAGLEAGPIWRHFAELARIPRPSGREAAAVAYIRRWADRHGFDAVADAAGNLRVRIAAREARARAPGVILQGHLDMVYLGAVEPITVVRAGDWVHADGTTLGADNGLGVATMLAAATDPAVRHGPLDLLFTVEEENGLAGASRLDPTIVTGSILINLDSEEDDRFTIGCAGGAAVEVRWARPRSEVPESAVAKRITIAGLRGGHSGIDINAGRLNAITALVQALSEAARTMPLRIAAIDGGDRGNAIPRHAEAMIVLPRSDAGRFDAIIDAALTDLAAQHTTTDPAPVWSVHEVTQPAFTYRADDSTALLDLLRRLPNGVLATSQRQRDLVESSCNVGVVRTCEDTVEIFCHARSVVARSLVSIVERLFTTSTLAGGRAIQSAGYPPWAPDHGSALLQRAVASYTRRFGEAPQTTVVHAGLECGVLKARLPGVDVLSFGQDIRDSHTARERVHAPSVAKSYAMLTALLADLASSAPSAERRPSCAKAATAR